MSGAFAVVFLADDGDHMVIGHEGGNLLPLNHRVDESILTFVDRGTIIRKVTLDELVPNPAQLRRTASHVLWGGYRGFDRRQIFWVETVDKRRIGFDPVTGLPSVDSR
jgi:hypothetical protein